jgi:uncharacterized protein YndB with AHSA1/START domain
VSHTVRFQRVFRAPPERVFRAFVDPDAMVKWLPPHGFTGRVHEIDARLGGQYRMSFTNISNGQSHSFGGTYLAFLPGEVLSHTDSFDDPGLPGQMVTRITFKAVSVGAEVNIEQSGIPEMIPPEACCLGWQESLQLLALLIEAEIPG